MTTAPTAHPSPRSGLSFVSRALINFEFAIVDAERLLKLHDAETRRKPGRPSRQLEVFKRAAIILSVTAWESFIEDTIRAGTEKRIRTANSPADIKSLFNFVACSWLDGKPKPPDLADWAGDAWKSRIRERLDADIQKLNTPNSKNVRKLSKDYLNSDITASWTWTRTSALQAAQRLDKLIELRGKLVHRGPELFRGASVRRKQVSAAVQLVKKLVARTEIALGVGPRSVAEYLSARR